MIDYSKNPDQLIQYDQKTLKGMINRRIEILKIGGEKVQTQAYKRHLKLLSERNDWNRIGPFEGPQYEIKKALPATINRFCKELPHLYEALEKARVYELLLKGN